MKHFLISLVTSFLILFSILGHTASQNLSANAKAGALVTESRPTQPYAIGSMTRFFHDETRGFDPVAGVESGARVLLTEIWYPVRPANIGADTRHPTYGDYVFGDMDRHRRMMTEMVTPPLNHKNVRAGVSQLQIDKAIEDLFFTSRASYLEVPVADSENGFPIIVMSHGDGGTRYSMETASEYLAANGYIVIAPEHTGNTSFAQTGLDPALKSDTHFANKMEAVLTLHDDKGTYGLPENLGQSIPRNDTGELSPEVLKHLDRALLQRVNDLRAILDILPGLNQEGFFKGAINLQRIGLMGRSLGGATTLAALGLEPRFKAGVAVVAPSVPDFRPFMPESLMAASSEESTMFSSDEKFPLGQLSRPTFLLNSAEDALILNINMALAMTFQSMSPSDVNPHPVLRHAFETSKAPVVWGMFDNGNHGIVSVSGPYWWPQLRPDRFPRYFDKATQYKLMPARQAHQIHIEKVLQFFDLTIRGDQTAKARLLDNPWKDQGFELEARNLD